SDARRFCSTRYSCFGFVWMVYQKNSPKAPEACMIDSVMPASFRRSGYPKELPLPTKLLAVIRTERVSTASVVAPLSASLRSARAFVLPNEQTPDSLHVVHCSRSPFRGALREGFKPGRRFHRSAWRRRKAVSGSFRSVQLVLVELIVDAANSDT